MSADLEFVEGRVTHDAVPEEGTVGQVRAWRLALDVFLENKLALAGAVATDIIK